MTPGEAVGSALARALGAGMALVLIPIGVATGAVIAWIWLK